MDYRFAALEALQHLREALEKYPNPGLLEEINALTALVKNQRFIVAVAGEFKRGKSSLINALLGMPVLPMDILPATATASRIVYGSHPSMRILKKDGSKQTIDVKELKDYVTKLTDEAAQNAKSIQEAVIEYPTILCQNGVEIVDTPGLNDSEGMEKITNDILQDVHAVVFAVSAVMPFSESEAAWLAGAIRNDKLQYLMFAVTFFDRVMKKDQQKVLDSIRERISAMVQERVQALCPDQPDLKKKAERLTDPKTMFLIPISSSDALDAIVSGDDELLQKSNLPEFKQSLMMAVNAHQNEYAVLRTDKLMRQAEAWLSEPGQQRAELNEVRSMNDNCEEALQRLQQYTENVKQTIQRLNEEIASAVKNTPNAFADMQVAADGVIYAQQGNIQTNDDVHNILNAATLAAREAVKTHYLTQWNANYLPVFKRGVELIEAEHDALLEKCRILLDPVPQLQETLELKKTLWSRISTCIIPELPLEWSLDITGGFLKGVITGGQRMAEDIGKSVSRAADFIEKKSPGFRKMKGKFEDIVQKTGIAEKAKGKFEDLMQKTGIAEKVEKIELPQLEIKEGLLTGKNLYQEIIPKISEGTTHLIRGWNELPERLSAILYAAYLDEERLLTDSTLQLALTKRKGEIEVTLTQRTKEREDNFKNAAACIEKAKEIIEKAKNPEIGESEGDKA